MISTLDSDIPPCPLCEKPTPWGQKYHSRCVDRELERLTGALKDIADQGYASTVYIDCEGNDFKTATAMWALRYPGFVDEEKPAI